MFRDPPHTEFGYLSSVADTVIPPNSSLYVATADICDCFYACNCPEGLEQFFCLCTDLTAEEVREVSNGQWEGNLDGSVMWSPCFKVLPMGLNWSFYLLQALHEQVAMSALNIDRGQVFLDGHPSPILKGHGVTTMPYCDNVHVMSLSADMCQVR